MKLEIFLLCPQSIPSEHQELGPQCLWHLLRQIPEWLCTSMTFPSCERPGGGVALGRSFSTAHTSHTRENSIASSASFSEENTPRPVNGEVEVADLLDAHEGMEMLPEKHLPVTGGHDNISIFYHNDLWHIDFLHWSALLHSIAQIRQTVGLRPLELAFKETKAPVRCKFCASWWREVDGDGLVSSHHDTPCHVPQKFSLLK